MYLPYIKYIIIHKKNVFIEAMKMGLYVHAFTHDLSKFRPSEFFPYARYFYGQVACASESNEIKEQFDRAWLIHQNRNPHHWDHWVDAHGTAFEMPMYNAKCMVADWKGMSRKFGDDPWEYFEKNREKMNLHPNTIKKVEDLLKP